MPMQSRLAQLDDEHGSLAAVLNAMSALVREVREHGRQVDPTVFRAILYYLDVFPEREHHRKEEQVLFPRIRARTHELDAVLDQLAREHAAGEQAIRELEQAFFRYEARGDPEFPAFADAAERYVARYFDHMHREEQVVKAVVRDVLTAQDLKEIEAAFATPRDPLAGTTPATDRDALFRNIVTIAPAPYGVGKPLA
jgi:hemerythrin-like domain-containing protein